MIGERVREAIESAGLPAEHGVLSISVGIAVLRDGIEADPDDLVAAADEAMYEAKRSVRRWVICSVRLGPTA